MQSIFVWKSDKPLTHSSTITYYSGSYWFMEESEQDTKSYQYHQQKELLPTSIHQESVFAWRAEKMGSDWVGSQLLHIETIPYHKVKEDSYAICEYIGDWFRCIVKSDPTSWSTENLEKEIQNIHSWLSATSPIITLDKKHKDQLQQTDEPCMIRFSPSSAKLHTNHIKPAGHTHKMHYTSQHHTFRPRYPIVHNG